MFQTGFEERDGTSDIEEGSFGWRNSESSNNIESTFLKNSPVVFISFNISSPFSIK